MIKVSKAFKVAKGVKTIHTQHNALAEAFNSRILSGLGDCAWRIFYYAILHSEELGIQMETLIPRKMSGLNFMLI